MGHIGRGKKQPEVVKTIGISRVISVPLIAGHGTARGHSGVRSLVSVTEAVTVLSPRVRRKHPAWTFFSYLALSIAADSRRLPQTAAMLCHAKADRNLTLVRPPSHPFPPLPLYSPALSADIPRGMVGSTSSRERGPRPMRQGDETGSR